MIRKLCVASLAVFLCGQASARITPLERLEAEHPLLYRLHTEYAAYEPVLEKYVIGQGFRMPYERLATIIHEKIHLASAAHAGFFIEGVYYEPYVAPEAWPNLRNEDVMPDIAQNERGRIYWNYLKMTPKNNLGNILDEVNAYTHVLKFICLNEPQSCRRQADNLLGHLQVVEAYLRLTRSKRPAEFAALVKNRQSSGAIKTITGRAWQALQTCGLPPSLLPKQETTHFVELPR